MALTDTNVHLPPTSGEFNYNSDIRPAAEGDSYVDPVFGETVVRMSNIGANNAVDDMYAHCLANADGTMYFQIEPDESANIRSFPDGALIVSNQPRGNQSFDAIWHPTDPTKYFFQNGTNLAERTVTGTPSTSNIHNFGSTLQSLGGTDNWCDKTGNIFAITYGGTTKVYNRSDNVVYSGTPSQTIGGNGWVGISPDGNYLFIVNSTNEKHYSYLLDHVGHSIGSPVMCWDSGGAHSISISASDATNYLIVPSTSAGGLWRCTVDRDREAIAPASQVSDTGVTRMMSNNFGDVWDWHMAHSPLGGGQDWIFIGTEALGSSGLARDNINDIPGTNNTWDAPYKQEMFALDCLTTSVRRLAHHRSRSINSSYYRQTRTSCSWDSSLVFWASNFNDGTPTNYSDIYGIANPLGAAEGGSSGIAPITFSQAALLRGKGRLFGAAAEVFGQTAVLRWIGAMQSASAIEFSLSGALVQEGALLAQEGFRWRNDDGDEATATWIAAQDSNISIPLNTPIRARVIVNATGNPAPYRYRLEYKRSSQSTYQVLKVGEGELRLSDSANITASGENTTPQLTPPATKNVGDFQAGRIWDDENGLDSVNIEEAEYTELEWCIVASAGATIGETYDLRVTRA